MKNKWKVLLAAALCLASLTACQGAETPQTEPYKTADVQAMADAGAFSEELESLDGDMAFVLYKLADYGLNREDLIECTVLRSAGATCEEGAVLLFQSEEQATQAKEALEAYVQSQIDANVDYRPEEIPKLEEALIDSRESSLLLVVAQDLEAAKGVVE